MKPIHPDIAGKQFDCFFLHVPEMFDDFCRECNFNPNFLYLYMEEAIATRHEESTPSTQSEHPPGVRYLETETVGIYYQVLTDIVEIGGLVSAPGRRPNGESYTMFTNFTE